MPSSHRPGFCLLVLAALLISIAPVSIAAPRDALQFNVPYRCPDGTTNTILHCASKGRGQVCFWREQRSGKLPTERHSERAQIETWVKLCRVPAASPQPSPGLSSSARDDARGR